MNNLMHFGETKAAYALLALLCPEDLWVKYVLLKANSSSL